MRLATLYILAACCAAVALCGSVPAAVTPRTAAVRPGLPSASRSLAAAQRVSLDGAAAAPAARVMNRPIEEVRMPDGTVGVRVDRRYFHTVVVCRHPDGHYDTECPGSSP